MGLAVFGANGPTGLQVVRQALAAGHRVAAVTRKPDQYPTRGGPARTAASRKTRGKEHDVPRLEVEGAATVEVEEGRRLVLAVEEDAGVDILHRCGGHARCTTCRVEYLEGEPEKMTRAELEILTNKGLLGEARLSCQALVEHDVRLRPLMTMASTGAVDPGKKPEPDITPEPEWVEKPAGATP